MSTLANKNLITMANKVSMDVIGELALSDGTRPSKDTIIEMLNDRQRNIASLHSDWTWLNAKSNTDAYDVTANATTYSNITATALGTALLVDPANAENNTSYYSSAYSVSTPTKVVSVNIPTAFVQPGAGEPYGLLQAFICNIVNGAPDLTNPVVTSAILNPFRPSETVLTNNTILFNSEEIDKGDYALVLAVISPYYNGVNYVIGTVPGSTGGSYKNYTSAVWVTGETMAYTMTHVVGTYFLTSLILPNTWSAIRSIKTNNGNVMLPCVDPHNGSTPPSGFFWVKTVNSDGTITLEMNCQDPNPFTFTIDGKNKVLDMVADSDVPQIPAEYRSLLEMGAFLDCVSLNLTINSSINPQYIQIKYDKKLSDLEFEYRDAREDINIVTPMFVSNVIDNSVSAEPLYKSPNIRR